MSVCQHWQQNKIIQIYWVLNVVRLLKTLFTKKSLLISQKEITIYIFWFFKTFMNRICITYSSLFWYYFSFSDTLLVISRLLFYIYNSMIFFCACFITIIFIIYELDLCSFKSHWTWILLDAIVIAERLFYDIWQYSQTRLKGHIYMTNHFLTVVSFTPLVNI